MPSPAVAEAPSVLELRQYTLHPGRRDELIALFEREFVETQDAAGQRLPRARRVARHGLRRRDAAAPRSHPPFGAAAPSLLRKPRP